MRNLVNLDNKDYDTLVMIYKNAMLEGEEGYSRACDAIVAMKKKVNAVKPQEVSEAFWKYADEVAAGRIHVKAMEAFSFKGSNFLKNIAVFPLSTQRDLATGIKTLPVAKRNKDGEYVAVNTWACLLTTKQYDMVFCQSGVRPLDHQIRILKAQEQLAEKKARAKTAESEVSRITHETDRIIKWNPSAKKFNIPTGLYTVEELTKALEFAGVRLEKKIRRTKKAA
jgi:hypothetical protein